MPHRARFDAARLAATAGVAALAFAGIPLGGSPGLVLLAAAVLLTGMPHGAVDHLVARRLFGWRGVRGAVRFYGAYLALAALYGVVWRFAPVASLVLFVLLAVYHFGQADMAGVAGDAMHERSRAALYVSRGLFVLGGVFVADPAAVAPVAEATARTDLPRWVAEGTRGTEGAGLALVAGQHVLALLACGVWTRRQTGRTPRWLARELAAVAVLTALFGAAPPLVAFAVYFGGWHALDHIFVLLRFFRAGGTGPGTLAQFYRRAAVYTALPLLGLGLLLWGQPPAGALPRRPEALATLFVLISVLTLPHMLLVEGLYRRRMHHGPQAATPGDGSS